MSKLRLACVATAAWATSTCAQPIKVEENASEYGGLMQTFKCKPMEKGQNRIVAADLPHTAIVRVRFKDKKAVEFRVEYVEDDGTKSSPAEETKTWRLVTVPGRRDYSWYAMANHHRNLLMHGRLFERDSARDGENRWFYSEEQFEDGVKTADYQAACGKEG